MEQGKYLNMGVSHCRVSNPKQSKQSMFIKVAWSGYQNLNMLQKTFTWVGDNSEFCDIRVRAMQGGFTHKGMHTHMYNSQILSNDGNWEIMSTYKSHILDSEFHFPLKIIGTSGRKC